MAQGYLIACASGADPQPVANGLGMMSLLCYKQNGVQDPMIFIKPTDFQALVDLLQFSPEICASLIGACLVIFIIGFSTGKVSRIISRR